MSEIANHHKTNQLKETVQTSFLSTWRGIGWYRTKGYLLLSAESLIFSTYVNVKCEKQHRIQPIFNGENNGTKNCKCEQSLSLD